MDYYTKYLKYKKKYYNLYFQTNKELLAGAHTEQISEAITNEDFKLDPKISKTKKFITYEWPEIKILSVEYPEQSGLTLIRHFNADSPGKRLSYYIDKRGKDIAGFNLDIINRTPNKKQNYDGAHSIVFVGGSSLGLEAVSGVSEIALKENIMWYNKGITEGYPPYITSEEFKNNNKLLPLHERIYGVCCFTKNLAVDKHYIYPDMKLGKFAMENIFTSEQKIYIKQSGVGLNSYVSKIDQPIQIENSWITNTVPGGVGAKFYLDKKDLKILFIINLNSIGIIHDNFKLLHDFPKGANNKGKVIDRNLRNRLNAYKNWAMGRQSNLKLQGSPRNTTLSILITNLELPHDLKKTITKIFHDEIESMIFPYGTNGDGDTFFLTSTYDIDNNIEDRRVLINEGKKLIRESIKSVFL